ncbi:hypothetical protein [Hymenobacter psychrotolerans]|uniref:Uncharacterized protein n=1 Tax=Hymenobacter psychrotolerans DSM 18569 TaxID=1121959 RepID=A0A1M6TII4_9BACT|nr:hypothetical protein [Hymenobacter psychrotolerans]SHK56912.1 hypothetical protein SAMN02746009_01133 [Hymenobacter psychrotolerans DSM 18569]
MADTPENTPSSPAPQPAPTEEQILADARLRELLAGYHPMYHELFLKTYARELQDLHYKGKTYEDSLEYLLRQHDKEAYTYLWMIQHQKLFDLECQWRAEQVDVPGALLTANFEDWHNYIEECPVLTPISPGELELFDAFLAQLTDPDDLETGNPSRDFWFHRRYPHAREEDEDDHDLSAWTQFWDLRRGTTYLRQLPDVRGGKELRYEKAYRRQRQEARPPAAPVPPDPRPHVPTWGDEYDDLVRRYLRQFEHPSRLRQFEAKRQLSLYQAADDQTDLEVALERLQDAGSVEIPIEAHANWRQAVITASNRYYFSQLRAALPHVYSEYCQRMALGIRPEAATEGWRRRHERTTMFDDLAERVRAGRRLLGEPDDLNF